MRAHDVQEWEPLPVSHATNALELLEEVIKLIEEEPLRYDQSDWLKRYTEFYDYPGMAPTDVPACGTIGCIAGWVATLTRHIPVYPSDSAGHAQVVLGLTKGQRYELFDGGAVGRQYIREHPEALETLNEEGDDWTMGDVDSYGLDIPYPDEAPEQGTPEYVALGVRHIRRFIEANREQLAAHAVKAKEPEADDANPTQ